MLRLYKGKRCISVPFFNCFAPSTSLILSILFPSFRIMSRVSLKCLRVFFTSKAMSALLRVTPAVSSFLVYTLQASLAVSKCCGSTACQYGASACFLMQIVTKLCQNVLLLAQIANAHVTFTCQAGYFLQVYKSNSYGIPVASFHFLSKHPICADIPRL